ncbi:CDP-glycerol glycerophosphotransferase family protein [Candidatus Wolfebacteria bacterium]|nr:CDP-glycerol glycerophosphotransferase family protein [Candidatus Wolfebacteria bacterium]
MTTKTIFIIVTRGFIVRNVLRSGVLGYLKDKNFKIVIFLLADRETEIPMYLKKEFTGENVEVVAVREMVRGRLYQKIYRLFCKLSALLIYTESTWAYSQIGNVYNLSRNIFWAYLERALFSFFGRIKFLKRLVRFIDKNIFSGDYEEYAKFFDAYHPDLVFSTSIISKVDIVFMKEARKRGVKTVSMTKGWDHMAKLLFRFVPDKLIVQNNNLKEIAIKHQLISKEKVATCGFPQFDWYRRREILLNREDFFRYLGLDPQKRLIFFGSEGHWAPNDDKIVDDLLDFIKAGKLHKDCQLIVRPHFSDLKKNRFERFRGVSEIKVDDNITRSDFFNDTWDPSVEEVKLFVNSIYHSDMMVTVASTLALDACCLNKPVIVVAYNALFNPKTGEDISHILYETNHYGEVLNTGAVDLVKNKERLLDSVNNYLLHPEHKAEERQILLNKLCYRADGDSSYRIFKVIEEVLNTTK